MRSSKKFLSLSVLAASVFVSAPALAELSGNVGATSDYVWRGVTQNNDSAAVQGGVDYTKGGFYAGIWNSSLTGGDYEADLYAGYKFELGSVGLDVGVIDYTYPLKTPGLDDSFYEGYVGASIGNFSAKLSHSPDVILTKGAKNEAATYVEAAYGLPVGDKSTLAFHVGNYSGNGAKTLFGDAYTDYSVSLAKDAFTFTVSKTTLDAAKFAAAGNTSNNPEGVRVFVTYKTSLGL